MWLLLFSFFLPFLKSIILGKLQEGSGWRRHELWIMLTLNSILSQRFWNVCQYCSKSEPNTTSSTFSITPIHQTHQKCLAGFNWVLFFYNRLQSIKQNSVHSLNFTVHIFLSETFVSPHNVWSLTVVLFSGLLLHIWTSLSSLIA